MKNIALIIVLSLLPTMAFSQFRHELDIHAGGGHLTSLNLKSDMDANQLSFGGQFGVGYSFYFTHYMGINIGVEAALFNGKYLLNSFSDAYQTNDGYEYFEFRYSMRNLAEKQQVLTVQIPLMLRFNTSLAKKTQFYAALGGKVGFPVFAKSKSTLGDLVTSGYYKQSDLLLTNPRFMGFGTFSDIKSENKLKLRPAFLIAAELGARFTLSQRLALYTGIYCDYGLNNINKTEEADAKESYIVYNSENPTDFSTQTSLLASNAKMMPFQAGIKISLAFNLGKTDKTVENTAVVTEPAKQTSLSEPRPVVIEQPPQQQQLQNVFGDQQRILSEQQHVLAEQQRVLAEQLRIFVEQKETEQQLLAEQKETEQQLLAEQKAKEAKEIVVEQPPVVVEQKAQDAKPIETKAVEVEQKTADTKDAKSQIGKDAAKAKINGFMVSGFKVGMIVPPEDSKAIFAELTDLMLQYPEIKIMVTGHTCDIGTEAWNINVGNGRAKFVRDYLVSQGIAANRIATANKRDTAPLVPNTDEDSRKKNRRVEMKVLN